MSVDMWPATQPPFGHCERIGAAIEMKSSLYFSYAQAIVSAHIACFHLQMPLARTSHKVHFSNDFECLVRRLRGLRALNVFS